MTEDRDQEGTGRGLARRLCQVVGLNQNYLSPSGALYHVQIEDRGPLLDPLTESDVRRVNVIIYANYGEVNARIIHGRDHDFPDVRTAEYNKVIEEQIQELAVQARDVVDDWEARQVGHVKGLLREYYLTKNEQAKREFEAANALHPFLFSRAWRELKDERAKPEPALAPVAAEPEVVYPLDPELRERVLEIERIVGELERDLATLRERGTADDILLQTCRKLVARAREGLAGRANTDFSLRRLEMTRGSLLTTWRQVRSRLR